MKLAWSNIADDDMANILEFIAQDNLERALSFSEELETEAEKLIQFPEMGAPLDGYGDIYRELHYKGYSIVYEIKPDEILIHEVFNHNRYHHRLTPVE